MSRYYAPMNYAAHFSALGVRHWESAKRGRFWWAYAIDQSGEKVRVTGFLTEQLAIEAALAELSALVH